MISRMTVFGVALFACVALAGGAVQAQAPKSHTPMTHQPGGMGGHFGGPGHGGGQHGGRGGNMMQALHLTPKQQVQWQAMMKSQRPAMMALFQNKTLTMPQKMAKMQKMQHAMQAKVNAILTPAQRKTWATMQAKRWMHPGGPGMHGGGPGMHGMHGGPPHGHS
jgi:Spy/CpxP family protein refolding chaperone